MATRKRNTNTSTLSSGQGTPIIRGKAEAEAHLEKLQQAAKTKRESERLTKWEADKKAANPQYRLGSVRTATADDLRIFAKRGVKCHGRVAEIECAECKVAVLVNTQDAHQKTHCDEHKRKASRKRSSQRRKTKKEASRTVEVVNAEIAALEAVLSTDTKTAKAG